MLGGGVWRNKKMDTQEEREVHHLEEEQRNRKVTA